MNASTSTDRRYDVIVVGARPAGAGTALLLARQGLDVLVVDRAAPGADTLSGHALMRPGVLQLHRWGVLDAITDAGTPAVRTTTFYYGDRTFPIELKDQDGVDALYAPRRTVIDPLLAAAAADAGAELRYGQRMTGLRRDTDGRVTGVIVEDDAGSHELRARVVVGADGLRSLVARTVDARTVRQAQNCSAFVMAYFDGPLTDQYDWYFGGHSSAGLIPTNFAQTLVFTATSPERFKAEVRTDVEAGMRSVLGEVAPDAAFAIDGLEPASRVRGFPGARGFIREAGGPGWALVGDASLFTDPMSAHGMSSALRDAELLARPLGSYLRGEMSETEAIDHYQTTRCRFAVPLLDAADASVAYQGDLAAAQTAHLQMNKVMQAEAQYLARLEPSLRLAA